ncbi:MAG: PilZ domain-containing protein [Myxococcaceae bacterium]
MARRDSKLTTGERKASDRRDSNRVPMTFLVRDVAAGAEYVERSGDLSLGGIFFKGKSPPFGTQVEVRFRLPGVPREVKAVGEIIRLKEAGSDLDFHVRFTELDVTSELAIAKHLDDVTGAG